MTWTEQSTIQSGWSTPSGDTPVLYDDPTILYNMSFVAYDGYADENWLDGSSSQAGWSEGGSVVSSWTSQADNQTGWQEN